MRRRGAQGKQTQAQSQKQAQKRRAQKGRAQSKPRQRSSEAAPALWLEGVIALAERLGYPDRDRNIEGLTRLVEACTHRTFAHEAQQATRQAARQATRRAKSQPKGQKLGELHLDQVTPDLVHDNQRLEFLGDAALGLSVASALMARYPDATEGELSARRARLINAEALAEVAQREGLEDHLRVGRGEHNMGERARKARLADLTEAVIGAIYLDLGLEAAQRWVERALAPLYEALDRDRDALDPKTALQQWTHRHHKLTPTYEHVTLHQDASGAPLRRPRYVVSALLEAREIGRGEAMSKREAEFAAARDALERLERLESER